jgi:TPR repeat protein
MFYNGDDGLPKDESRALHWYRKVATNAVDDLSQSAIAEAARHVEELS